MRRTLQRRTRARTAATATWPECWQENVEVFKFFFGPFAFFFAQHIQCEHDLGLSWTRSERELGGLTGTHFASWALLCEQVSPLDRCSRWWHPKRVRFLALILAIQKQGLHC